MVIRVDCARWGQTPDDLRHLALSAPHARTRERALALFDITQHRCATQVAVRTGRRAHTVMEWVHAYNQGGPDALTFRRTGGRLACPPCAEDRLGPPEQPSSRIVGRATSSAAERTYGHTELPTSPENHPFSPTPEGAAQTTLTVMRRLA